MNPLSPTLILSMMIATTCGVAFHTWRGEGYHRLVGYVLVAWVGFALGQLVAWLAGWEFAMIGEIHMLEGLTGSLLLLVLAGWLRLK